LKTLQREQGMSYLFITHDLGVVAEIADDVAVMYKGKIVENGSVKQVLTAPQHPYTQKLLAAVPKFL
jgi:ABC-type dipeptide/oligopeptide/nickel transport system ATPase component